MISYFMTLYIMTSYVTTLYRVFKKNVTLSFSLISLAIDMLEGRYISHLKGGIHSSVWSTKTFLYNIREPRYKQNDMGYKMSRIWYNQQSDYLEIWYCQDLCIISLAMNILGGWDTSNFKGDIFRHVWSSNLFLYNIRQPK